MGPRCLDESLPSEFEMNEEFLKTIVTLCLDISSEIWDLSRVKKTLMSGIANKQLINHSYFASYMMFLYAYLLKSTNMRVRNMAGRYNVTWFHVGIEPASLKLMVELCSSVI